MKYVEFKKENPTLIESIQGRYLELLVEATKANLEVETFLSRFQRLYSEEDRKSQMYVQALADLTRVAYWQLLNLFRDIAPLNVVPFLFIDIHEDETPTLEFCFNKSFDHAIHFDRLNKRQGLDLGVGELVCVDKAEKVDTRHWSRVGCQIPHFTGRVYERLTEWKYNFDHLGSTVLFSLNCSDHGLECDHDSPDEDLPERHIEIPFRDKFLQFNPDDRTVGTAIGDFYLCVFKKKEVE